jgi:hypothetical protein
MDVLYVVRKGERNSELRYSLRSLANLPDVDTVWIVGHKPRWIDGVGFVPGNRHTSKWHNVPDNLRIACEQIPVNRFVVMNDDFYVTRPVSRIPSWYRGPLSEHIRSTRGIWQKSLQRSAEVLGENGYRNLLSYELHVPVVMEREKLAEVLKYIPANEKFPAQWRTLYGNWWQVAAEWAPDCKLRTMHQEWVPGSFLSTDPGTFRRVESYLASLFPEPSPYEVTPVVAEAVAA